MAELNLGHVVGPGVPTGGTSGQILKKNSSTNFDTSWTNNDATTIPMSSSDATSINEAIANKANFVSLGTFTETTFSDFLKAVCASYYSNSEADKAVNFVATWSDHDYYTGMIRRHGVSVYCSIFVGNDIASCQYNATNQTIIVNDINSDLAKKPIVMEVTGTTSSSGALLIPTVVVSGTFLSAWGTNTAYFIYRRDNTYFMVRDTNLNVVSETEITIKVAYIPA